MATVSKAFTVADLLQGPLDWYLDVQAPPSANPPVQYTNTLQLDASGQPPDGGSAGLHLGLSEGPGGISINPKFQEIHADQFAGPIDAAFVSLECEIDFPLKESKLANIQKYWAGVLTGTYTSVIAGANPACDFLQIGTPKTSAVNLHTLMGIVPDRGTAAKWAYIMAYKCYLASAIALPIGRSKETVLKLKWKCIADTSRVAGDQVLQIVRMT